MKRQQPIMASTGALTVGGGCRRQKPTLGAIVSGRGGRRRGAAIARGRPAREVTVADTPAAARRPLARE